MLCERPAVHHFCVSDILQNLNSEDRDVTTEFQVARQTEDTNLIKVESGYI